MDKVLLIHKLAPAWQVGKLNGLGGKIEEGEDGLTCIVREIKEESGLVTEKENWEFICNMHAADWSVDSFGYVYKGNMEDAKSMEQEQIEWFDVNNLPENVVGNLKWLIPLTIDKMIGKDFIFKKVDVEYE